jgi:hypothetical protein
MIEPPAFQWEALSLMGGLREVLAMNALLRLLENPWERFGNGVLIN